MSFDEIDLGEIRILVDSQMLVNTKDWHNCKINVTPMRDIATKFLISNINYLIYIPVVLEL